MSYSKTTDEIIRELNDYIAKLKKTANKARACDVEVMAPYWNLIANKTDALADEIQTTLTRVSGIADHPDEITSRYAIIKAIEDTAFGLNIIAFCNGLTIARSQPQNIKQQEQVNESYYELARDSAIKAKKIIEFLNELATLIINDMREAASNKIQTAIQAGEKAVDTIPDKSSCEYIRLELGNLVDALTKTPINEISLTWLDDNVYRLKIIKFAAEVDTLRGQIDTKTIEGIDGFIHSLQDAYEFFETLIPEDNSTPTSHEKEKFLYDVAYQGNILLFYFRGEVEKLSFINPDDGSMLINIAQKTALEAICAKIHEFITLTHNAKDETAKKGIVELLNAIKTEMTVQADELKQYGGPVKFISIEFGRLEDVVSKRL